jgi:hypothetical protein
VFRKVVSSFALLLGKYARLLRSRWKVIALEAGVVISIAILSIRSFLIGSALFSYSDQSWPGIAGVAPSGVFSWSIFVNGTASPFQFTRDVITWPIVAFDGLLGGPLQQQKAFLLYSFVLFLTLAYILAEFTARLIEQVQSNRIPVLTREWVKFISVFFAFSNLATIGANVDGGTVSDGIIYLLAALAVVLVIYERANLRSVIVASCLLSISLLLDPVLFPEFAIAILASLFVSGLILRQVGRSLRMVGVFLALSAPALIYIILLIHATSITSGPYYNLRQYSLSTAAGLSANATPTAVFSLLGNYWSTLTYAPPSILPYSGGLSELPSIGSPTQILLPPGIVTEVWVISLLLVPVFAFSTLLYRRFTRVAVPVAMLGLLGFVLTRYTYNPILSGVITLAVGLPLVGGDIGTSVALPGHFLALIVVSYMILVPIGVYLIATRIVQPTAVALEQATRLLSGLPTVRGSSIKRAGTWRGNWVLTRASPKLPAIIAIAVTCLVALPGWQAINGSYFPSRASPPTIGGNGVPGSAPYAPISFPANVTSVYSFIHSQRGDFNIYWPDGGTDAQDLQVNQYLFHSSDAPKPLALLPSLPYLIQSNLSADITAYLRANDVLYVVVENSTPDALAREFGLSSAAEILETLTIAPGLSRIIDDSEIVVFQVSDLPGFVYNVPLVLTPGTSFPVPAMAYDVFDSLGVPVALAASDSAVPSLSLDNGSGAVQLYTPTSLTSADPTYTTNVSASAVPRHFTIPSSGYANVSDPELPNNAGEFTSTVQSGNWTLTNWGQVTAGYRWSNGSVSWNTTRLDSAISLSYNGTLASGAGGVVVMNPGVGPIQVAVNLTYDTSPRFAGNLSVFTFGKNASGAVTGSTDTPLTVMGLSSLTTVSTELPTGTRYFDVRVQSTDFIGGFTLRALNISWTDTKLNLSQTQVGDSVEVGNWTSTNWGLTPLATTFRSGVLTWNASTPVTLASFSYNGTLADGTGGVDIPPGPHQEVAASISFEYKSSPDFVGLLGVSVVSVAANGSPLSGTFVQIQPSGSWTHFSTSIPVPASASRFTPRIQVSNFLGGLQVSDAVLNWSLLHLDSTLPFGAYASGNQNETLMAGAAATYAVLASGTGELNGVLVERQGTVTFSWTLVRGFTGLHINGSFDLAAVVVLPWISLNLISPPAIVYTQAFYPDLVLAAAGSTYSGVPSIDGAAIFVGVTVNSNETSVGLGSGPILTVAYPILLAWVAGLALIGMFWPYRRRMD